MWMRPAPLFFFPQTSVALPCFGFRCHSPCRRPWRIPAGMQTAKDTSCQDLMTRVISPRGNVSLGAARPVSPRPSSPPGPGRSGRGRGGGVEAAALSPLPPFLHHHHSPRWQTARAETERLKWAINVQGTPPRCSITTATLGSRWRGGVDGASQTAMELINYQQAAPWDKPCC